MAQVPPVSQREFLSTLWGEDNFGIAELTPIPKNPKSKKPPSLAFSYPSELDKFIEAANSYNEKFHVFMGICLRREKWPRKTGRKKEDGSDEIEYRGTKENALSSMCVWTDIDFGTEGHKKKGLDPEKVRQQLAQFPCKPSIVAKSGNGIHVYWLLKEPAVSTELLQVEAVNRAIYRHFGSDSTGDLARILRLPGTLNIKTDPPKPCEISHWKPDRRYTLFDFDFLSTEAESVPDPAQTLIPESSPAPADTKPAVIEEIITVNEPTETLNVDVDALPVAGVVKQIIRGGLPAYIEFRRQNDPPKKFSERESSGKMSRSESDAFVITSLLQAEVQDEVIYSIFRNHPKGCGEKYAEKGKNGDAYLRHTVTSSKKTIKDQPKWSASHIAGSVANKIDKEYEDEKFKILLVTKYNQEPPTYEILVSLRGKEYSTRCGVEQAYYYEAFKKAFFSKHDVYLPSQRQATWVKIYEAAKKEEKEVEAQEGTAVGQIESAIDDLIVSAVGEKSGASGINHMAVKTDDGELVFKTPVLLRYLKSQGIEIKRNDIIHHLKEKGWKGKPHRFGKGVTWVWSKAYQNGKQEEAGLFTEAKS